MKIHLKYTIEEVPKNNIWKEITLDLADKVLDGNSYDVKIKYDEKNVHETPGMKRKYYETFGIDEESLRKKNDWTNY